MLVPVITDVVGSVASLVFPEAAFGRNTNNVLPLILNFFCFMAFFHETYQHFYGFKISLYGSTDFLYKKAIWFDKKDSHMVHALSPAYISMGDIFYI